MLGTFNAAWYIILESAVMYPVAPPLFIRVIKTLRAPVIVLLEINLGSGVKITHQTQVRPVGNGLNLKVALKL